MRRSGRRIARTLRAVVDGALGLALTAVDYLGDEGLRTAAHAEFEAAGGALDVPAFFD